MRNDELLRRDLAVYIFNDSVTRDEILRINHDDFEADYFVYAYIKTAIRRKYYWSKMFKKMMKYVCIYSNCQWVQTHHHKLYEKLMFIFSESMNSFHIMIMKIDNEIHLYMMLTTNLLILFCVWIKVRRVKKSQFDAVWMMLERCMIRKVIMQSFHSCDNISL